MHKNTAWLYISTVIFIFIATGCNPRSKPEGTNAGATTGPVMPASLPDYTSAATLPPPPSPSITQPVPETATPSPSSAATLVPSDSPTPTASFTFAPSLTPTYAILRGSVLEQANCRYGPGAAYLYKYGLYPGNNIEIIGRNDTGTWIVIQTIGGTNPCWIKASLLDISGDVMSVAPAELPLPMSPYYGPLTGVYAERHGNEVIISWNPMELRAGDDSLQYPYLVEAWLCQNGRLTFNAIGSWETMVTVQDDPVCAERSHARVYGVEKHGYTLWVTVPWPAP